MKGSEIMEKIVRLSVGQIVNFREKIFIYSLSNLPLGGVESHSRPLLLSST